ncbi:hypothetical protein [Clostridium thailandense]
MSLQTFSKTVNSSSKITEEGNTEYTAYINELKDLGKKHGVEIK